jgi:serine/threonine-protein kinase
MGGESSSDTTLSPGDTLGPYTIVRAIGRGAAGAVYEARKQPLDKRIALKLLHAGALANAHQLGRFQREARAAAALRHPNIVDVDDVGVIDGVAFLAMEFLEGETLGALLKREGPLPVGTALDLMLPVLSAVAAINESGVVHRDLKPDNVFLWRAGGQTHPKLLDFGVAKLADPGAGNELTQTGDLVGTPNYMAPEQWKSARDATAQSDQWALAVILFRCLTGRLPFEADDVPTMVFRVTLTPPTTLRTYVPELPESLEREVLRGLEKDPAHRHPSVRAFAQALLPFATPGSQERWRQVFGAADPTAAPTHPLANIAPGERSAGTLDRAAREVSAPEGARRPMPWRWSVLVAVVVASAAVGVAVRVATHRPHPEVTPVGPGAPRVVRASVPTPVTEDASVHLPTPEVAIGQTPDPSPPVRADAGIAPVTVPRVTNRPASPPPPPPVNRRRPAPMIL